MNEVSIIKVSVEDSEYLEAISFDLGAHRSLIDYMVSGDSDLNSPGFARYHEKYKELYASFELAKIELEKKYLGDLRGKCDWNLDFATHEITVKRVK